MERIVCGNKIRIQPRLSLNRKWNAGQNKGKTAWVRSTPEKCYYTMMIIFCQCLALLFMAKMMLMFNYQPNSLIYLCLVGVFWICDLPKSNWVFFFKSFKTALVIPVSVYISKSKQRKRFFLTENYTEAPRIHVFIVINYKHSGQILTWNEDKIYFTLKLFSRWKMCEYDFLVIL